MRTIYQLHRFKNTSTTLVLFLAMLFVSCSGYQSVSYYQDGIYGEAPMQQVPQQAVNTAPAPQQNGTYYKNYFAEKASQGIQDDYIFTDSEQYQSPEPEQTSAGNYQAHGSWGDQTDRININVIYNQPFGWNMGWGWYDAPYTFGRSAFWGHNYHPWYFTFGFYHNSFYNPYRFGWGFRGNYWNSWGNQNPYWNRYNNRNVYRNSPIYSSLNGGRGASSLSRGYSRSSNPTGTKVKRSQTNSRNSSSLRSKMRRSRTDNSYPTNQNNTQQRDSSYSRSDNTRNNNSGNRASNNYNSNSRSSNGSYNRTRSSSNRNFSRTSAGSRNSTKSSSRRRR